MRWFLVLVVVVVGCGGGDRVDRAETTPEVGLPWGLEQVEGTEAVGRVAVYDDVPYTYLGEPVESRSLRATYRVTADDPLAVVREWAEQLDGLALDGVQIESHLDTQPDGPWVSASASGEDWVDLQLWATGDGPILLVSVDRTSDDPPRPSTVTDDAGSPPPPEPDDLGPPGRVAGDVLFTEQGDRIHLPEGTTALTATIPTFGGTGGSTTVLAADDGEAAVRALIDEALATDPDGEADEPVVAADGDVEVVTADFVITAGGWGFDVVSVQGPDDATATLYVTSSAD